MALAAEGNLQATSNANSGKPTATGNIIRLITAAILMALAANCFLKYLWWTAYSSTLNGIPKVADQWRAAAARASFNGWSMLILELASIVAICTIFRFRLALRILASLAISIAGTAVFALVLSWIKQGTH